MWLDDYLSRIWMQLIGHNIEQLTFKQESIVILHWDVSTEKENRENPLTQCVSLVLYWFCEAEDEAGLTNLQP